MPKAEDYVKRIEAIIEECSSNEKDGIYYDVLVGVKDDIDSRIAAEDELSEDLDKADQKHEAQVAEEPCPHRSVKLTDQANMMYTCQNCYEELSYAQVHIDG